MAKYFQNIIYALLLLIVLIPILILNLILTIFTGKLILPYEKTTTITTVTNDFYNNQDKE
jgi:hypothetical protein